MEAPMLSLSLAQELGNIGYNLLLQGCALRPLDLIGFDGCRHYLVGPLDHLIESQSPLGFGAIEFGQCQLRAQTSRVTSIIGARLLESFLTSVGVDPFRWERLLNSQSVSIQYDGLEDEFVNLPDLEECLRAARVVPSSSLLNDFVFSGGDLFVVTDVLRTTKLSIRFEPSSEPLWADFQLLRDSLVPDITPTFAAEDTILLESGRPATLAIRIMPLAMSEEKCGLHGYQKDAPLGTFSFHHNIVPWLASYPERSGKRAGAENPKRQEYILLPDRGIYVSREENPRAAEILELMERSLGETTFTVEESPEVRMLVLDSISPLGPKLVRMRQDSANALQGLHLGLRVEPLIYYEFTATPPFKLKPIPGDKAHVTIRVTCAQNGIPIEGAEVVVSTDWKNQYGEYAKTDAQGEVHLPLGALPVQVERLYVKPPSRGYWGAYRNSATIVLGYSIALTPIDPAYVDSVRRLYGTPNSTDGTGVRVAVIDCGVGPHPDLVVAGGRNVVQGENVKDISDNGDGHGTHVAGIIAGRGTPPGLAPGVELYSYRVVGSSREAPHNFLLLKALVYACDDGCDIVNLSLGLDQSEAPHDETLKRGIEAARDSGCVVIAAAGNSGKRPVTRLAKYVSAEGLAVSAFGHKGAFPPGSIETSDIEPNLWGDYPNVFFAEFSNFGDDVSLTAPGVGVISTVPNGGYRPLSGTSMSAPVVAGFVARLIQQNSPPLPAPHDRRRVGEILNRTVKSARRLGFPREREGAGLPGFPDINVRLL
jgi:Subtilase family